MKLQEKSVSRLYKEMSKPFAIISAFRHENKFRDNRARNRSLASDIHHFLDVGGLSLVGHWRESPDVNIDWREVPFSDLIDVKEDSYMVSKPDDISFEEFKDVITLLTKKYQQDASIISDGEDIYFLDKNGSMDQFAKNIHFNKDAQAYSTVKGKSQSFTFTEKQRSSKMGLRDIIREEVDNVMEEKMEKLKALSGMAYHGGKYDVDYWIDKTGVDPRDLPEYIGITKSGLCYMKEAGRNALENMSVRNSQDFNRLGVGSKHYPSGARFIEEIRKYVEEALEEMTTTADIGGYTVPLGTPPADFKKNDKQFAKNNKTKNTKKKKARQTIFGPQTGKIKKGNKAPFTQFAKGQTNVPFKHKKSKTNKGVSDTPASSLVGEAMEMLSEMMNQLITEKVYDLYRLSADTPIDQIEDGSPSMSSSYEKVKSFSSTTSILNYAKKRGWKFRKDASIFGGHFFDPETEDVYQLDVGEEPSIFDISNVREACERINAGIDAPLVKASFSTLGGEDKVSILVLVALQPREEWTNGILENSDHFRLHLDRDGTVEQFGLGFRLNKKFRKRQVKSIEDLISKVNEYITQIGY